MTKSRTPPVFDPEIQPGTWVAVPQQPGCIYQREALVLSINPKGYRVQRFRLQNGVSLRAGSPRVVKRAFKLGYPVTPSLTEAARSDIVEE